MGWNFKPLHPHFFSFDYDTVGDRHIAHIRLYKDFFQLVLGKYVKPVRLHTNNKESLIGKTAYLTGFGIINGKIWFAFWIN